MSLPAPEVLARPARLEEMPRSAVTVAKKAKAAGLTIRVTYARGPRTLDLLEAGWIADSIRVTARDRERNLFAVGHWITDKNGDYGFDFGYVLGREPWTDSTGVTHIVPSLQRCNFTQLKAYLVNPTT